MKIGMIICSYSGHTLTVAEKIKTALLHKGNEVTLVKLAASNEDPKSKEPVRLLSIPDLNTYDVVIFGAPVIGGQLAPVMREYLTHLSPLHAKKAGCFITQHFPWKWMGASSSVQKITKAAEQGGASVLATGIVQWSSKMREDQINQLAEDMCNLS